MKRLPSHLADDPFVRSLLEELAEKESAYRLAQQRLNDLSRDWVYRALAVGRGPLAILKWLRDQGYDPRRTALQLALLPWTVTAGAGRTALRLVGLGRPRRVERDPSAVQLRVGLNRRLPSALVAGKGNSFMVEGWAFHPAARITHLEVRLLTARPRGAASGIPDFELADLPAEVVLRHLPDARVLNDHHPVPDARGYSYYSGFYAAVTVPPQPRTAHAQLVVRVH